MANMLVNRYLFPAGTEQLAFIWSCVSLHSMNVNPISTVLLVLVCIVYVKILIIATLKNQECELQSLTDEAFTPSGDR